MGWEILRTKQAGILMSLFLIVKQKARTLRCTMLLSLNKRNEKLTPRTFIGSLGQIIAFMHGLKLSSFEEFKCSQLSANA